MQRQHAEVVVIGAGLAGLFVWQKLRRRGVDVLLVEAGGPVAHDGSGSPDASPPSWRYRCAGVEQAHWLRAHGVGGRAALWGGWLTRFSPAALASWPSGGDTLAPHYDVVERYFGVRDEALAPYFTPLLESGLEVRSCRAADGVQSAWRRTLVEAACAARAWAPVLHLDVVRGRAHAAIVRREDGGDEAIRAPRFVLAASPIETCRVMLASGARHPRLGENLTDHLGVIQRLVEPPQRGGREPPRGAVVRRQVTRTEGGARSRFLVEVVGPMPVDPALAAFLREQGVSVAPGSTYTSINALGEQQPRAGQRTYLHGEARDALGRAIPVVELRASADDRALLAEMRGLCEHVASRLAQEGATLVELGDSLSIGRIFHPAGTVMRGPDECAPCREDGRTRDWDNVHIADASLFASSGDAHPTLTALALADQLSEAWV